MPKGATPISDYTRYYEAGYDRGQRIVFGVLTRRGDQQIHIGHDPIVSDGGCSVIDLTYDIACDRITMIRCHGR